MRSSGCVPGWDMSFSPPPRGGEGLGERVKPTSPGSCSITSMAKPESPLTYDTVKLERGYSGAT
jgi:hypothetical protein